MVGNQDQKWRETQQPLAVRNIGGNSGEPPILPDQQDYNYFKEIWSGLRNNYRNDRQLL